MELSEILRQNYDVSPEAVADFLSVAEVRRVEKGEMLAEQDKYCGQLFLIISGFIRFSILKNGEEETVCFGQEGCGYMSFNSYFKHGPAFFGCMALTPLEVYSIDFAELDRLMDKHISVLRWFNRALVEEFYLMEARANNYRSLDAYSRFKMFITARSEVYKAVPAKYIAQYLRVRPETLYRLRARFLKEKE